jgi:UDP-glucose 4-epimerase
MEFGSNHILTKKTLVTGGAGFIGWRVCRNLAELGHDVSIVDNLHVGMAMPSGKSFETHKVDVRDTSKIQEIVSAFKPDTIIHLAAIHHIPTCERERSFAQDVNILGTENLLSAAEKAGTQNFVLASSGAVYDWLDAPLDEDATPLRACDNYALSKYSNEQQTRFWSERTEAQVRVARIFNTIGHDDPNAHLIPDILNQLHQATGEVVIRLGNLKPRRDYIHAEDTAAGIVALSLDHRNVGYDIMNVATGREASVAQLVQKIGDAKGVSIRIETDETRVRRVDRLSQLASVEKIKNNLGWSAKIELDAAVASIVQNFNYRQS